MPATIATIIAVSTDAMILFHSKDDIAALRLCRAAALQPADGAGRQKIGFRPATQPNYHASGAPTNRASCRSPFRPKPPIRPLSAAPQNPIVMIPARLAATRLPNKPLADIAGAPMIVHVWRRAVAARVGPVVVACGDREIADVVEREGGRAGMTDPELPTGSDRIHAALGALEPG